MKEAIETILAQVRPKIHAILRTRSHYDVKALINQFKTHVWSLMEIHSGTIFHAAWSYLSRLDDAQYKFLAEIGITEEDVFIEYHFAPPTLRRDIGILGLLHKRVLGKCHPVFQQLLLFHRDYFGSLRPYEHDKQLYAHVFEVTRQYALHDHSIFAMVYVYNRLPQECVDIQNVSLF